MHKFELGTDKTNTELTNVGEDVHVRYSPACAAYLPADRRYQHPHPVPRVRIARSRQEVLVPRVLRRHVDVEGRIVLRHPLPHLRDDAELGRGEGGGVAVCAERGGGDERGGCGVPRCASDVVSVEVEVDCL